VKLSAQTKSFLILITIAVIGTYLCIILWGGLIYQKIGYQSGANYQSTIVTAPTQTKAPEVPQVDTANWETYENKEFNINFKHPQNWKVLAVKNKDGFNIIEIDPGAKYFNIKLYISKVGFYIMDGLPTQEEFIGGVKALNVSNSLFGMQNKEQYYTFDLGWSTKLLPEFYALVHSVQFPE
jgi:hypothetical protein